MRLFIFFLFRFCRIHTTSTRKWIAAEAFTELQRITRCRSVICVIQCERCAGPRRVNEREKEIEGMKGRQK